MKYAINLFPRQKSEMAEKSLYFIANYLRYALVLSLLAIIIIFFLRMRLDQQLIDEKEKLALKRSIVNATKELQSDLNTTQYKIKTVQSLLDRQDEFFSKLSYINGVVPQKAIINSLKIDEKQVIIEGTCPEHQLIQSFAAKLRSDGRFGKVTLSKVTRDKGMYSFSVVLEGFTKVIESQKS